MKKIVSLHFINNYNNFLIGVNYFLKRIKWTPTNSLSIPTMRLVYGGISSDILFLKG